MRRHCHGYSGRRDDSQECFECERELAWGESEGKDGEEGGDVGWEVVQGEVDVLRTAEDGEDDAVGGFHEIEVGLGECC